MMTIKTICFLFLASCFGFSVKGMDVHLDDKEILKYLASNVSFLKPGDIGEVVSVETVQREFQDDLRRAEKIFKEQIDLYPRARENLTRSFDMGWGSRKDLYRIFLNQVKNPRTKLCRSRLGYVLMKEDKAEYLLVRTAL
jgi:hypothetical protein